MIVLRLPTMTHFRARALEWQVAGITLLAVVMLVAPYQTLDSPVFQGMRAWGDDLFWASIFLVVGSLRIFALWRNGAWVPSPWIRFISAAISAAIWSIVCLNIISEGWGFFITAPFIGFVLSDIYSAGRATTDARLSRDDRLKQPEAPRVLSVTQ